MEQMDHNASASQNANAGGGAIRICTLARLTTYSCCHELDTEYVEYVERKWPHYQSHKLCPTCVTGHKCVGDFVRANNCLHQTVKDKFSMASPTLHWPDKKEKYRLSLL